MSNETSKAIRRRFKEHDLGEFPWRDIIRGRALDVGCGPDKLKVLGCDCIGFDTEDGDANKLSAYFEKASFDLIHGSHVLEHMHDPRAALRDWITLLKPGGHIVQTVPDWCAYERMQWPSRYNPDHKSSWSLLYLGSIAPIHIHIPSFLAEFKDTTKVLLARYVERNYDWHLPQSMDQTFDESANVEIWNEFVLQKL